MTALLTGIDDFRKRTRGDRYIHRSDDEERYGKEDDELEHGSERVIPIGIPVFFYRFSVERTVLYSGVVFHRKFQNRRCDEIRCGKDQRQDPKKDRYEDGLPHR